MPSKMCTKCKEIKDFGCFSKNKRNKTHGLQPRCIECNRAYYYENQDRIKKRINDNYHANHEEELKKRKELRKRPEAKKIKAKVDKKYNEENKEKIAKKHKIWAAENREYLNKKLQAWYHKNLEHARLATRASTHRRRCKIRGSGGNTLTTEEIKEMLRQQPFCSYCGSTDKLEIDHVIPIFSGGQNNLSNVVVACKSCNCSKGHKKLIYWLAGL